MTRPPSAKKQSSQQTYHGITLHDDYAWLRDPDYPQVKTPAILDYLKAENDYFEAWKAPHQPLIEELYAEMKGRIKEDDSSVPVQDGAYLYWRTYATGAQYRQWWRKPVAGGTDELLLDEPALAAAHDYFRLGALCVSEDGNLLAYSCDTSGDEHYSVTIKNLATGEILPDVLENVLGDIIWSTTGDTLLYGALNAQWRVERLMAHRLGTAQAADICLYQEQDVEFQCGLGMTQSRRFILLTSGTNSTAEVRLLDAADVLGTPLLVRARETGVEYDIEEREGTLYVHTNLGHSNFRLMTASLAAPDMWQERIAGDADFYMTGMTAFQDFFVIEGRKRGQDEVRLYRYDSDTFTSIAFPTENAVAGLDENPEFATAVLRLSYDSMTVPDRIIDYDIETRTQTIIKEQLIPSGYNQADYVCERLEIEARDGVRIPVSLVTHKDYVRDGRGKLVLYGYGAYGIAIAPSFSTLRLSLLNRGFAYAIAHIRGGDDLGQQWQLDGKLEKRWNSFHDYIDVAQGLITRKIAGKGRICGVGGSAGGELMGVALNEAPALFGAIAAHVPFVDVLNTMLDETLPLTPGEWSEWGNPLIDEAAFALIRSYSPYDNIRAQALPPLFITAGINDPRVTYWEPAKWAAKLRAHKQGDSLLLLKTNMDAGHGGKSGRFESLWEDAEEYAFFIEAMG
jgi:oligopeptidase B